MPQPVTQTRRKMTLPISTMCWKREEQKTSVLMGDFNAKIDPDNTI